MIIESEKELLSYIMKTGRDLDAVVVEGYDGVGKGRLLNILSERFGVTPYRPDYNLWQSHDHRSTDRWKVSGFFWDVFSHFYKQSGQILLFDRGVISGAVYNNDISIARDYKKLLRGMRVLHVLVTCEQLDFRRFLFSRTTNDVNVEEEWQRYLDFTQRYIDCLEEAGVEYVKYENHYSKELHDHIADKCESCGHYSYGCCRHPEKNGMRVSGDQARCKLSIDKEVQDRDDAEMYSLQS